MKKPYLNRNYNLLLASQFLSAFGDAVILAIIIGQLTFQKNAGAISESQLRTYNAIYTSLLFVPYVVLAPLAGFLNDRYAKTRWLFGGNLFKVTGSLIAMLSIWHGYYWQGIGYFIVGIGSCIFGPAKYGILPEILPAERLVKANGTVELLTLLAILFGPLTGAMLVDKLPVAVCYLVVLAIFGASMGCAVFLAPTPHDESIKLKNSVGEFFHNFGDLLRDLRLSRVLLGTGLFWACGAVMKINFQPWGMIVFDLKNNTDIAKLGLWLGLGIMAGSVLAGQLHRVGDLRATRWYGWLLAATLVGLSFITVNGWLNILVLVFVGIAAGLFLIPLNAALQAESHQDKLGKTIATQNFVDNLAMIIGAGFIFTCVSLKVFPSAIFFGFAVLVAFIMIWLKFPTGKKPVPTSRS